MGLVKEAGVNLDNSKSLNRQNKSRRACADCSRVLLCLNAVQVYLYEARAILPMRQSLPAGLGSTHEACAAECESCSLQNCVLQAHFAAVAARTYTRL